MVFPYYEEFKNLDLIQIQQYYEKQAMLRGVHIQEGESKRRKLRR
jgi:hypothetical protein